MYQDFKYVSKEVGKIGKALNNYVDDIFGKLSYGNDLIADHYHDEF